MCGEHMSCRLYCQRRWGSSPHVRGARGAAWRVLDAQGSSPHVRGAHDALPCLVPWQGIIPACAGSTNLGKTLTAISKDHPRMCGEHVSPSSLRRRSPGSSPHVRGAPGKGQPRVVRVGIIPACAGSTLAHTAVQPKPWDHPRMCGEHRIRFPAHDCNSGSSPHVRGARPSRFPRRRRIGIIPACAGSTPSETTSRWRYRDHPRMCGEHVTENYSAGQYEGSSPHVRGAHGHQDRPVPTPGIIPACAGSTGMAPPSCGFGGDHPRMCGEH